jgi:hypothetical protein
MKLRQEPAAHEGAGNTNNKIADNAKAGALHNLAREPSGNHTDYQND